MNTIRVKIAMILFCSIMLVVGLATATTIFFVHPPEVEKMLAPTAAQITMLRKGALMLDDASIAKLELPDTPLGISDNEKYTAAIRDVLAKNGTPLDVVVRNLPNGTLSVAIPFKNGKWICIPFPNIPLTNDFLSVLGFWLLLIILGTSGMATLLAYKITTPFTVIEKAIASVGEDGVLPHVEVHGTPGAKIMADALNRLSTRLRCAMESRMRLVAAAGHDLRTPMTRMWLRAEFLNEEDRALWVKDLEELDRIADSAIRLVREEAGGGDREPVSFSDIVHEIAEEGKETGLKIELGVMDSAEVVAGPLALKRALRNLIQNAATHGGGAHVSVLNENNIVKLYIDDNGPGIPEETIDKVFEPFFRVDRGRRQIIPGAGLGLAIAKEIVERFSGSIAIENRKSGGLRQTVAFQRAA